MTMDYNSSKNQAIKDSFVQREVFANVNSMVNYIIKTGYDNADAPFIMEDIENYWSYPEYHGKHASFDGGSEEMLEAEKDRLQEMLDAEDEKWDSTTDDEPAICEELREEISELEELESEPQEVYEWWIVSGWLLEKLQANGEPVIPHENIWGRCTTGQSKCLDWAISKICADLEILEGQQYEWKL